MPPGCSGAAGADFYARQSRDELRILNARLSAAQPTTVELAERFPDPQAVGIPQTTVLEYHERLTTLAVALAAWWPQAFLDFDVPAVNPAIPAVTSLKSFVEVYNSALSAYLEAPTLLAAAMSEFQDAARHYSVAIASPRLTLPRRQASFD